MKKLNTSIVLGLATLMVAGATSLARAEVTAEEAAKLKTTLMPLGGEKAGNADGTIPAWTGGLTQVPAGYVPGKQIMPDVFASEKPYLTITAQNYTQYASKLDEGAIELFKKMPDYRMEIFPTHRTAAAPQYVYDNTFANATRSKSSPEGWQVSGAYGGIPFPIPKTGAEVMWNVELHWQGEAWAITALGYMVPSDGNKIFGILTAFDQQYPYYAPDGGPEKVANKPWVAFNTLSLAPAEKAGQATLALEYLDYVNKPTESWSYLPGQRRVRKAPNLTYDTPNFFRSGVGQFDDTFGFFGALDQYNWKLVGKKEMYVPYNTNRLTNAKSPDEMMGPKFANPDLLRFELHRVWVVDATLAPNKTNVVPHRRIYVDEDSWVPVEVVEYDASDKVWRYLQELPNYYPEFPCVTNTAEIMYELHMGLYSTTNVSGPGYVEFHKIPVRPESAFTPESLAASLAK